MSVTGKGKPREKSWRDVAEDVWMWIAAALFLLTLPLSFPALLVYKKVRGGKIRGKGTAFMTMLWMISVVVSTVVIAAYLKKGWSGLETLLYLSLACAAWAFVVFIGIRVLGEIVIWGWKFWQWLKNRLNK